MLNKLAIEPIMEDWVGPGKFDIQVRDNDPQHWEILMDKDNGRCTVEEKKNWVGR